MTAACGSFCLSLRDGSLRCRLRSLSWPLPQAAAIVRTTIELGRQLGLRVIAEGVETADQRAALVDLGCAAAQGYHFFKPVPADRIVGVLRSLLDTARAQVLPLRADGAS